VRRAGLFWKLVSAAALLTIAVTLLLTWIFASAYEAMLERQLDQRLRSCAASLSLFVGNDWPFQPTDDLQVRVRQVGEDSGLRITLISPAGDVVADSSRPNTGAARRLENHRDRPEFMAALRTGEGVARRISPSIGERLKYYALRVSSDGRTIGVVRVAGRTAPLVAEAQGLARWLWFIGVVVVLTVTVIAAWLAARVTEPLRGIAANARALAAGEHGKRLPVPTDANDELGTIAAALGDIDRRLTQRERLLTRTSEMHATVLEGMTESVIAVGANEKLLFANAAAGRAFGFGAAGVENLTLLEAVRSHELRAVMLKALRSRQLCNAELTWRGKKLRVFDALAAPLPGNPPSGVVLVLRDISELKRLEQMRQQFIANVSHELKTPLSSIKAYTETLLAGARNDPVHCERFLTRIDEQTSHLHQLVLDMLSLARIEGSHQTLELTDVRVADVIRRCLADYEPQAAARQVALVNLVEDDSIEVRAEVEALRQILSNLVDNAIKYTPSGGRVEVNARRVDAMAALSVTDNGVGIPPEHHGRLFERFYRVDNARSRELGGTGLGLSIVKHLASSLGGSVAVSSQVSSGTVFTVKIPLARAQQPVPES
jgi:two-component system phosphate regulon sensor histidine kinase PhoR